MPKGQKQARPPPSPLRETLGRKLRDARRAAGLTQARLSELTGLAQDHISHIERGQISVGVDTIDLLARHLGLDPSDLLSDGTSRKR